MYKLIIRPLLFLLTAEQAHHFSFFMLKFLCKIPGFAYLLSVFFKVKHKALSIIIAGLTFENRVGLAAGFDKDAKNIDEFAALGFGFIEVGTITPKAQPGNDLPRLFRLKKDQAIINRMGFNNHGVEAIITKLKARKSNVIIGGNIGKNKLTSNEDAVNDYVFCFNALFNYVDYFVVNVSSPNTPNLRALQDKEPLTKLLTTLQALNIEKPKSKPIFLKISPDLNTEQLNDVVDIVTLTNIAGIVATNTTLDRQNLISDNTLIQQAGGLSGMPLNQKSTEIIRYIAKRSNGKFPIIAVGGIYTAQDALDKLNAGASLVQLYSGFIYEGPSLIKKINKALINFKN